jgi:hypothetical protein
VPLNYISGQKVFMNTSLKGLEKHVLINAGTRAKTHEGPWGFVAATVGTPTQRKGVV